MAYYSNNQQPPPVNPGYAGYSSQGTAGYQPQGQNPGWNMIPPGQGPMPHYAESGTPKHEMGFSNLSIRAAFIRKVFFMVSIMLAVVTVMAAIPFMHQPTKLFIQQSRGIYFLGYFTFLVVYIALMCCESVRRSFPANIICTAVLTLSIGYMTMVLCSMHHLTPVVMCLAITCICCAAIIIFASQTKYDLTSMMGFMFIASMVLMVFGLVAAVSS